MRTNDSMVFYVSHEFYMREHTRMESERLWRYSPLENSVTFTDHFSPSCYTLRQRRDSPCQLCPVIANCLLNELLDLLKHLGRHYHLPDTGHILAIVRTNQGV